MNRYCLQSCVWEITLACCFSCKYCGSKAGIARENELTTQECLDVVGQLADMGCQRVTLIGGEVFMRTDWFAIIKALTESGIRVSIISNGYLFSKEIIKKLKKVKIESVAISLDGSEAVHDSFRQVGSYNRAIQAIDVLAENNIPVSVISTLHSENILCLDEMYEVLKRKRIFAWQLQACSPMGNASLCDFSTVIDFSQVINFVKKHLGNPYFAIGIADNIGYNTESEGCLRGDKTGRITFRGCKAGLTTIGIDSIGNVRGCESMYDDCFIEGNLRKRRLAEIWNDPNAFSYNRNFSEDQLTGKCRECEYRKKCAGGCRSYNYFFHGKLYESLLCVKSSRE